MFLITVLFFLILRYILCCLTVHLIQNILDSGAVHSCVHGIDGSVHIVNETVDQRVIIIVDGCLYCCKLCTYIAGIKVKSVVNMIFFDVVVEGIFDAFILVVQSRSVLKILLSLDGAVVPSPVAVTCYTIDALINNFVLIITDCFPVLSFDTEHSQIVIIRVGVEFI